jgi:hypothetical protein
MFVVAAAFETWEKEFYLFATRIIRCEEELFDSSTPPLRILIRNKQLLIVMRYNHFWLENENTSSSERNMVLINFVK